MYVSFREKKKNLNLHCIGVDKDSFLCYRQIIRGVSLERERLVGGSDSDLSCSDCSGGGSGSRRKQRGGCREENDATISFKRFI